ncbi:MAG: hypothetical protein GC179_11225 [Anaerolineaceae bacterium]|nr:hypothetical protein [Anaerolineaceae bacterium]
MGDVRLSLINNFAFYLFIPLPVLLAAMIWIGPHFTPKPIVSASDEKSIRVLQRIRGRIMLNRIY